MVDENISWIFMSDFKPNSNVYTKTYKHFEHFIFVLNRCAEAQDECQWRRHPWTCLPRVPQKERLTMWHIWPEVRIWQPIRTHHPLNAGTYLPKIGEIWIQIHICQRWGDLNADTYLPMMGRFARPSHHCGKWEKVYMCSSLCLPAEAALLFSELFM